MGEINKKMRLPNVNDVEDNSHVIQNNVKLLLIQVDFACL